MKLDDIPTMREIEKDYKEAESILSKCHSVEDARYFSQSLNVTIEIGSFNDFDADICSLPMFDNVKPEQIDWFRLEACGCLGYIYYYTNGDMTMFDVFAGDDTILDSVTMKDLATKYNKVVDSAIGEYVAERKATCRVRA